MKRNTLLLLCISLIFSSVYSIRILQQPATGLSSANITEEEITPALMERMEAGCLHLENCIFYQVNATTVNYGCTHCAKDFLLESDQGGSGVCKGANTIPNCIWAESRPGLFLDRNFCWQCENNFVLTEDFSTCNPLDPAHVIEDCESYYIKEGIVYCNSCSQGMTVDANGSSCLPGCTIENCDYCQNVGTTTYCYKCKPNFIGVYLPDINFYTQCLSCRDWQISHLSSTVLNNFSRDELRTMLIPAMNETRRNVTDREFGGELDTIDPLLSNDNQGTDRN